jgi:hypothetical protein
MLTGMYWQHRPGSSPAGKVPEGDLPGQAERLEHARIGEHHVARDPAAGDRETCSECSRCPPPGSGA